MSLYDYTPASGPPPRKGDDGEFLTTVDAMKIGLKAHYAKKGIPVHLTEDVNKFYNSAPKAKTETSPSVMKEALKTGLRAWYNKRVEVQHLTETTMQPMVGARHPERALGDDGVPGKRKRFLKGGTSLRDDISRLEKQLEYTLLGLDNSGLRKKTAVRIREMLSEALCDIILKNNKNAMKDVIMHTSLVESHIDSSRFIGDPSPETEEILTTKTDTGATFKKKMEGMLETGPMIDLVATQLSAGTPIPVVMSNIEATLGSTASRSARETLIAAQHVLGGMND